MRLHFFRFALLAAGLLHLLPVVGALWPEQLMNAYGIAPPDAGTELLLRHRASLFGLLGVAAIAAAFSRRHMTWAALLVGSSMALFILFYLMAPQVSSSLRTVCLLDVGGLVLLIAGWIVYRTGPANRA